MSDNIPSRIEENCSTSIINWSNTHGKFGNLISYFKSFDFTHVVTFYKMMAILSGLYWAWTNLQWGKNDFDYNSRSIRPLFFEHNYGIRRTAFLIGETIKGGIFGLVYGVIFPFNLLIAFA